MKEHMTGTSSVRQTHRTGKKRVWSRHFAIFLQVNTDVLMHTFVKQCFIWQEGHLWSSY